MELPQIFFQGVFPEDMEICEREPQTYFMEKPLFI